MYKRQVQDQYGNTVTGDASTVTLTSSGPGSLTGCTPSKSSGVTTFSGCTITTAGTYTLTATDGLLNSATSSSFIVSPAAASKLAFTAQPGGGTGGTAWTNQPTVTVQDAYGNTVTGAASVTIAIGAGPVGGTLSGTKTVAAAAGVATFTGLSIDKAGTGYTLSATSGSLTGATSTAFDITVGTANKLAFTAQPTNTLAGASISPAVTVTVQDAGGNTVTTGSSNVTIAVAGVTPPPVGGCVNPQATSSGVATFSGCTITTAGTYTLTATDGLLNSATSTSFIISASTASKLAFTRSPGNTTAGNAFASQPQVTVQDQYGNTVTTDASAVTIAVTGGTATVTGCTSNPQTASGGIATFGGCTITKAGTGYQLHATDGTLTPADSTPFTISAAAAWAGIVLSSASLPATCGGPIDAISCSYSGGGGTSGYDLVANLTLVDEFGNVVANTGSSIGIDLVVKSGKGGVNPSILSILNPSTTSGSFTLTLGNGAGKTVTMTATVRGTGQTLTVTLNS